MMLRREVPRCPPARAQGVLWSVCCRTCIHVRNTCSTHAHTCACMYCASSGLGRHSPSSTEFALENTQVFFLLCMFPYCLYFLQ